jgi:hypothetical protein
MSMMALSLLFAAGLIQQVVGITCDTDCAACWKTGSPGIDTKFSCRSDNYDCGKTCPSGYQGIHCAKVNRC